MSAADAPPATDAVAAALLLAPAGRAPGAAVRRLADGLATLGLSITQVADLPAAVELVALAPVPPCVLLDLSDLVDDPASDERLVDAVDRALDALPHAAVLPVLDGADGTRLHACVRAGVADVLDLARDDAGAAHAAIERAWARQAQRARLRATVATQRQMIEELLRDLVKTERRTIDAEERLARQRRITGEQSPLEETRAPAILLVEDEREVADALADRLEQAGMTTYAYVSAEEAIRGAAGLAAEEGLDLALVAAQLPGIDGLEAVPRLRAKIPGLPAFLITAVIDAGLAAAAANLGVVGFVQKPFQDLDDLVLRLTALARESLERAREHAYLERIKARHERVLARYRALPREP